MRFGQMAPWQLDMSSTKFKLNGEPLRFLSHHQAYHFQVLLLPNISERLIVIIVNTEDEGRDWDRWR